MGQPHPKINRGGSRLGFLRAAEALRQSTRCRTKMSRMPEIVAQTRYSWKRYVVSLYTTIRYDGGGRGIRTPERVTPLTVFKTAAFNHSAIPPTFKLADCRAAPQSAAYHHDLEAVRNRRRPALLAVLVHGRRTQLGGRQIQLVGPFVD